MLILAGTNESENQEEANRRIPHLVAIPAAVRFLSVEPIEPVDVAPRLMQPSHGGKAPISWIIVGGESGGGARPIHPDWVRGLRDQVRAAGAKLFVKQSGSITRFGQVSPARAKTRHNGRPICGYRNSRSEVVPASCAEERYRRRASARDTTWSPRRNTEVRLTRRWRKADSNRWSPATCDARDHPLRLPRHSRTIRTKPTPSQEGPLVRISFPPAVSQHEPKHEFEVSVVNSLVLMIAFRGLHISDFSARTLASMGKPSGARPSAFGPWRK